MITTSAVEYTASGRSFGGVVVSNDSVSGAQAGVLVLHGGAGIGEHERERARMLCELGYVAFVPDLFGEKFRDRAHGTEVIMGLVAQPAVLRGRVGAALRRLCEHPGVDSTRTAAIGFCLGGLAALELARDGARVSAIACFHGGLSTSAPASSGSINCRILVCTGAADPFITREHRAAFEDEMTGAGADWEMIVHGGAQHAFTERHLEPARSKGAAYHATADRRSWRAMREMFDDAMAPESRTLVT